MLTNRKRDTVATFPLRLMPSVRKEAEQFSQKEGVSLNQFVNLAVAEKLIHLQHQEWLASKPAPTTAIIARGLASLDKTTPNPPDPGDEAPPGFVSVRHSSKYKKALASVRPAAQPPRAAKQKTVS